MIRDCRAGRNRGGGRAMRKLKNPRMERPAAGSGRTRAYYVLLNADSWTMGPYEETINLLTDDGDAVDPLKVSQLTSEQIIKWPNAGKKTVAVIKEWLAEFGLHLRKSPVDKNKILRCQSFLERHGYQVTKLKKPQNWEAAS